MLRIAAAFPMHHATVVILVYLAVCHGRPIASIVPIPMSYVSSLAQSTTLPIITPHYPGVPLTAVITTSEERTTTFSTATSSIMAKQTIVPSSTFRSTVTPTVTSTTTVENLSDHLYMPFELYRCVLSNTVCYFSSGCIHPFKQSAEMSRLSISSSLLRSLSESKRLSLMNCPVIALVNEHTIELRHTGSIGQEMRLSEYGLTINNKAKVRCSDCLHHYTDEIEMNGVQMTVHQFSRPSVPTTPSSYQDNLNEDGATTEGKVDCEAQKSGKNTSVTEIVLICLLVLIAVIVLALCIAIHKTQRALKVAPVPPAPKIPSAWPPSSRSNSSVATARPMIPDDLTDDYDERTPAAVSPVRTANTVSSASNAKLLVRPTTNDKDREATMPDFSAKPLTPSKETILVSPSKDPEQKKLKSPERKEPKLGPCTTPIQSIPRTPLVVKQPLVVKSLYDEVSTQ